MLKRAWRQYGGILPLVVAFVLSGMLNVFYNKTLSSTRDRVQHSFEVNDALNRLEKSLLDIETGQRGFVITGDGAYLEPYERGENDVLQASAKLQTLITDNGSQTDLLKRELILISDKRKELSDVIDVRRASGFEAAQKLIVSNFGKTTMDEIRLVMSTMRTQEATLLSARLDSLKGTEGNVLYVAVISILLALIARLVAMYVERRAAKT